MKMKKFILFIIIIVLILTGCDSTTNVKEDITFYENEDLNSYLVARTSTNTECSSLDGNDLLIDNKCVILLEKDDEVKKIIYEPGKHYIKDYKEYNMLIVDTSHKTINFSSSINTDKKYYYSSILFIRIDNPSKFCKYYKYKELTTKDYINNEIKPMIEDIINKTINEELKRQNVKINDLDISYTTNKINGKIIKKTNEKDSGIKLSIDYLQFDNN